MKQSANIAILSVLSLGTGFLSQWYIISQLGAGGQTDALFAGMTLPSIVLMVISGSIMHVLVPILSVECGGSFQKKIWSVLAVVVGFFIVLFVLLFSFSFWWVPLIVPGFSHEAQQLTIELTHIQLFGMVFSAVNGVQWAVYHAKKKFIWVEISTLMSVVVSFLLLIYILPLYGVIGTAWLMVLRVVMQVILLLPEMKKPLMPDFYDASVLLTWQRLKPLLLGAAYYKTDIVIDRLLLSMATTGSLTLFYLAQQIYGAMGQVINKALCAPIVPILSALSGKCDVVSFRKSYYQRWMYIALISSFFILFLFILGYFMEGAELPFGYFTPEQMSDLYWILIWLTGMFFGSGTGQLCALAFYSIGDTVTPTKLSMITYTIYTPVKIGCFMYYGVLGLAVSMSLYYLVNLLAQMFLLERRFRNGI